VRLADDAREHGRVAFARVALALAGQHAPPRADLDDARPGRRELVDARRRFVGRPGRGLATERPMADAAGRWNPGAG
jgi:hypothetical protein